MDRCIHLPSFIFAPCLMDKWPPMAACGGCNLLLAILLQNPNRSSLTRLSLISFLLPYTACRDLAHVYLFASVNCSLNSLPDQGMNFCHASHLYIFLALFVLSLVSGQCFGFLDFPDVLPPALCVACPRQRWPRNRLNFWTRFQFFCTTLETAAGFSGFSTTDSFNTCATQPHRGYKVNQFVFPLFCLSGSALLGVVHC